MSKLGMRHNKDKLQWSAMPMFLIRPLAEVATAGAKKYKKYNFLKGLYVTATLDSAFRHIDAFCDPEKSDYDKETKCHHLAHAAWNCLVALFMANTRPDLDDRYKGEDYEEGNISTVSDAVEFIRKCQGKDRYHGHGDSSGSRA